MGAQIFQLIVMSAEVTTSIGAVVLIVVDWDQVLKFVLQELKADPGDYCLMKHCKKRRERWMFSVAI